VQPQEYIEYFEDSAKASLRAKIWDWRRYFSEALALIGRKGAFCKGLAY